MTRQQRRWMVRLEHARPAHFGEPTRSELLWAVTPYMARHRDGRLLGALHPTYFASRTAATAYARREMHRHYGRPHP